MPLVFRAYAHALAPHRPPMTDTELSAHMGGPPEKILAGILRDPAEVADALQRLTDFGAANWHLIRPFAGARELLEKLRARGCATAVWTGRERASTEILLREHRFESLLGTWICGDDFPSHKPAPEGLAEALRRIAVTPSEALLAGDHDADVLGGVALKVRSIRITHGQPVPEHSCQIAWKSVNTPAEAYRLIDQETSGVR